MKNKGFSLIEVLVGIAIIITTTTIVLSIIVSSFRISNKTTSDDSLRQNGNYAIAQISRMLQFAELFEGVSTTNSNFDPSCLSNSSYNYISFTYRGSPRVIACSTAGITIGPVSPASLIDTNTRVAACTITCQRRVGSGPVIGISFDLRRGGTNTTAEKTSIMNFSTKVNMRNID